ncbi:MAG: rRNA maturation RNase YbeY [Calditrichia bacterium]|nr:rRNA maturation RNase YbeY [Calditrichia bacterium]
MKIQVHNEIDNINLSRNSLTELTRWLCNKIKLPIETLDIIFTDDENLRDMHEHYLDNKDYTDVMAFNLGTEDAIEGEIYISGDRAQDNTLRYDVPLEVEICRLIIHACLHLAGYEDNNESNRQRMKKKEEDFLSIVSKKFLN